VTRYTADSRDRVRDAVDMVALVSTKVELRRAGVNSYFGHCPFHDERTPSFHVSPDEKLYHCFGCSESGDPFDFVMQTEGLDFKGALESLADRFGVPLQTEEEDPAAAALRARRERLYSLLSRASTFYARHLWDAREAATVRDYLGGRGFSEQTLRDYRIGYAAAAWDRLVSASRKAGFTNEELLGAGLAQPRKQRPDELNDRFRERIMFPTADERGRVRGFGARAVRPEQQPKYLNTAEGDLYHKREVLYGIDLARAAAAKSGRIVLVEGYTDVLAMHQAGVTNVVGIMGTSLTREQVARLVRLVSVVELCLDADRAGQEAMLRAAALARDSRLELRVVPLPVGCDPGDLLRSEGAEALIARAGASVPFVSFAVERALRDADTTSAEGKDRAIAELAPLLAPVPASVLRDELLHTVAGKLELPETRLAELLAARGSSPDAVSVGSARRGGGPPAVTWPSETAAAPVPLTRAVRAERSFLALCVALPEQGAAVLASIDPQELLTSGVMRRAASHLAVHAREPLRDLPTGDDELARVVADLVQRAGRAPQPPPESLEHARLLLELARLDRQIARARAGHEPGIGHLARQRQDVLGSIRALGMRLEQPI
jgi:DNA primase